MSSKEKNKEIAEALRASIGLSHESHQLNESLVEGLVWAFAMEENAFENFTKEVKRVREDHNQMMREAHPED